MPATSALAGFEVQNMDRKLEDIEAIAAKSNLVATAGEFIPKSQVRLEQERYDNNYFVNDRNQYLEDDFQENGAHGYENMNSHQEYDSRDTNASSTSNPNSGVLHSSKFYSHNNFNNTEQPNCDDSSNSRKSNIFYSRNREPKYSKSNQNKSNDKWRRVEKEFVKSDLGQKSRASEKVSLLGGSSNYENDAYEAESGSHDYNSYSGRYNKQRQKNYERDSYRYNDRSYYRSWGGNSGQFDRGQNQQFEDYQPYSSGARSRRPLEESYRDFDDNRRKNNSLVKNGYKTKFQSKNYDSSKSDYTNKYSSKNPENEEEEPENDKMNMTNQRERLIDLLTRGALECLVCCEKVHQSNSIWNCSNCYHVLHLKCTIKWAKSSKGDFGWRCPACQNVTRDVPYQYRCFCGKVHDPDWNRNDCPHSCGEICRKTKRETCPHKCVLLCHPGPCPQCVANVTKSCGCQKTSKTIQCYNSDVVVCDNVCEKTLNCGIHKCMKKCHMGSCDDCTELIKQACFCEKENREVKCLKETAGVDTFSCGNTCDKQLACGNHTCSLLCHEGECPKCEFLPELVKFCPCGKTELSSLVENQRDKCTDSIPTCDSICGKKLQCGQPGNPHTCQNKCHEGSCPSCPLETAVKCRCGHMDKMVPCSQLKVRADDARCDKRCSKKRNCGKHKCNQLCCIDIDHVCPLPCNKMLQCGSHRCEETCHRGYCRPCWRASFDELYCECGAEVIFPPVPCGTRRPACSRPCTRAHACEHPPTHNCHSDANCPPCTVLTKKYCHGRHELRKAVPCHQGAFSCGLPCNKELPCGRHKCISPCHAGPCLKEGQICTQPCTAPRPICGHHCNAPCHDGSCPLDQPCKEMVRVTCECGHRFTTRACHDNAREYQRIATAQLASKMADLKAGQTIDLNDVVSASKKLSYKTLECNGECKLIERNRRLAIALQIRNPDLSAKLTPRYSDFMRQWAKKDPRFCQMVHDKLTDLVQLAKQSKQKSRSYSFDSMNRDKRHFVHEYCEHFGCESVAYDQEPKRNVVATALKEKSWLPSMSLLEVIQRESGPRKVPAPVNAKMASLFPSQRTMEILPVKLTNHQVEPVETNTNQQSEPQIDYFEWTSNS